MNRRPLAIFLVFYLVIMNEEAAGKPQGFFDSFFEGSGLFGGRNERFEDDGKSPEESFSSSASFSPQSYSSISTAPLSCLCIPYNMCQGPAASYMSDSPTKEERCESVIEVCCPKDHIEVQPVLNR